MFDARGNLRFENRPWNRTRHSNPLIVTEIKNIIKCMTQAMTLPGARRES